MGVNVASSFTNAQRIVVSKGRYYAQFDAVMPALMTKFRLNQGEVSITVNRYQNATAEALTDGVDMTTSTDISMDTTSLTTSEYGLKIILTDKMIRQNNDDAHGVAGKLLGNAMAKYRDQQALALFAGITTNTIGAAGTALIAGHIAAAHSILLATPAPGPYVGVFHPYTLKDLWDDLTKYDANGNVPWPDMADAMIAQYIRGKEKVTGIPIFTSGNLTPDGDDDVISGIFSSEAFALTTQKAWSTETQRDATLRATELVCVADEGFAEIKDDYAVQCTFDAAQETS